MNFININRKTKKEDRMLKYNQVFTCRLAPLSHPKWNIPCEHMAYFDWNHCSSCFFAAELTPLPSEEKQGRANITALPEWYWHISSHCTMEITLAPIRGGPGLSRQYICPFHVINWRISWIVLPRALLCSGNQTKDLEGLKRWGLGEVVEEEGEEQPVVV